MIDFSHIEKVERIQKLNQNLLDVLTKTARELILYANEHNMEHPYKIKPLLEQAQKYIHELKSPTKINKECSVCNKHNLENAEYCCYCGSSLVITHVSPDMLHGKRGDSNHPKSDSTD